VRRESEGARGDVAALRHRELARANIGARASASRACERDAYAPMVQTGSLGDTSDRELG
jgi:hypothetical protein